MKTSKTVNIERKTMILEEGVDFTENDLEIVASNGVNTLKRLSLEFRENFYKLNIGTLVWSGHYDEETKSVRIDVEKDLFI